MASDQTSRAYFPRAPKPGFIECVDPDCPMTGMAGTHYHEDSRPVTDRQTDETQTSLLRRTEAAIDAILRGNHAGWDQALAALRKELREAQ